MSRGMAHKHTHIETRLPDETRQSLLKLQLMNLTVDSADRVLNYTLYIVKAGMRLF